MSSPAQRVIIIKGDVHVNLYFTVQVWESFVVEAMFAEVTEGRTDRYCIVPMGKFVLGPSKTYEHTTPAEKSTKHRITALGLYASGISMVSADMHFCAGHNRYHEI